jgi:hypothetical protein
MGIADSPEGRFLMCLRLRLQPGKHVGFGNDFTYSIGDDDYRIPEPLQAYRHEVGAMPFVTFHAFHQGFTPYLRVGPHVSLARMVAEEWRETRTYIGGHGGIGFEVVEPSGVTGAFEVLGFAMARLDDSPRPDGAEDRGGYGVQLRLSVGYAFWL